ncbi:MAG: hypothetical protein HZB91_04700 [Elusimicrobia bacterium]|nr:hypothetical protein [Elusimicrobiota bacterium]
MPARPVAPRPLAVGACATAVALFAFLFNRFCGFHFYGNELAAGVIEGGYRVYLGQAPFLDFFCPFGPVLFWMLAAFYKLFGVTYAAYIALGSVMNAAVWYMPVCAGGPIITSSAFFFVFIAACLLLGSGPDPTAGPGSMRTILTGLSLGLAFTCKTPVGMCAALKRAGVGTVALDAGGELPRDDETSACLRDWLRKDFTPDRKIDDRLFFIRKTECGGSRPRCP